MKYGAVMLPAADINPPVNKLLPDILPIALIVPGELNALAAESKVNPAAAPTLPLLL